MTLLPVTFDRLAGDDDLAAVAALEAASFTNPWTREMLAKELAPPSAARVYLLRTPGVRVAAFCSCWVFADELHINTIAVRADLRRQGLGRVLMQSVLADVTRDGVTRATLEVRRSNEAALALYRSLGFTVSAVRPRYYTQPEEDALILWRETTTPDDPHAAVGRP